MTDTFKFQPDDGVKRRAQKALNGDGSNKVLLSPCDVLHTALVSRSDEPRLILDPWAFWGRPFHTRSWYYDLLSILPVTIQVTSVCLIGKGNIFVIKVYFTHIPPPSPSLPLFFVALHHTTSACAPDGLRTKRLHVLGGQECNIKFGEGIYLTFSQRRFLRGGNQKWSSCSTEEHSIMLPAE